MLIFLLILLIGCAKNTNEVYIEKGDKLIKLLVEIADDNLEREQGLMFREMLDQNNGMLFIFENESYQTFWMKNTLIPLDIIFIDKNYGIVDIKNAIPCEKDPCSLYKSTKPSKYVLEVNGNFIAKNSIRIEDRVIFHIENFKN